MPDENPAGGLSPQRRDQSSPLVQPALHPPSTAASSEAGYVRSITGAGAGSRAHGAPNPGVGGPYQAPRASTILPGFNQMDAVAAEGFRYRGLASVNGATPRDPLNAAPQTAPTRLCTSGRRFPPTGHECCFFPRRCQADQSGRRVQPRGIPGMLVRRAANFGRKAASHSSNRRVDRQDLTFRSRRRRHRNMPRFQYPPRTASAVTACRLADAKPAQCCRNSSHDRGPFQVVVGLAGVDEADITQACSSSSVQGPVSARSGELGAGA